jgi:hypothetical protein
MRKTSISSAIITLALATGFAWNSPNARAQQGTVGAGAGVAEAIPNANQSFRPGGLHVQQLDINVDEHDTSFAVLLDQQAVMLKLKPHSLRSGQFQVFAQGGNGKLTPATPRAVETFRGTSPQDPTIEAALTIRDGEVKGIITSNQATWWIQPLVELQQGADAKLHGVYRNDALVPADWACGTEAIADGQIVKEGGIAGPAGSIGCLKKAQIAFDADFEYFQFFNLPKAVDPVADTVADIESVMNAVDFIYRRDTGITYELTTILVQTVEPDPYTSNNSGVLLDEFGKYWEANHTDIIRDVAHLFTGKDVDGNVIGVAWLAGVCNGDIAYGLSQSKFTENFAWRVRLTAHEIGHNWSAPHCNQGETPPCLDTCNIMCSSVSGCVQAFEEFEPCSRAFIIGYRDAIADLCLDTAGDISFAATRYVAPEVLAGDRFGTFVAMDGDVAIVGSYTDDDQANDTGSAYILRFDPKTATWVQEAKLTASDAGLNDRFGTSVDIADYDGGEVAIIGAMLDDDNGRDAGAAYIFRNTGGGWVQEDKLIAEDGAPFDLLGRSVSINRSGQHDLAILGAAFNDDDGTSSGSAYIFRNDGSGWLEEGKLLADDAEGGDQFGISVGISSHEGNELAIVGAYNDDLQSTDAGSAYIFQNTGKWTQAAKIVSPHGLETDQFGYSVDILAAAESRAIVGAWKVDVLSQTNSGEAYVYRGTQNGWAFEDELRPSVSSPDALFGCAVSLRADAAMVGSYLSDVAGIDSGAAFVYKRVGFGWAQQAMITPNPAGPNDQFGISVGLGSADQLIIGAWADDGSAIDAGAIYITNGSEFLDCNENGVPDSCDIASGVSLDEDADGIPDECQKPPVSCAADISPFPDGDGVVDVDDLLVVINGWGDCPVPPIPCQADVAPLGAGDGVVDVDDLLVIINGWGPCPK